MKKGYLKYLYMLLVVFILSIFGSYAFFSWGSGDNNNTNVSFDVVADSVYIYYNAGSNITGADLYPTDDKENGIKKDITVKVDKVVSSKPVTFNLYLDLTDVPTALMNSSFKWALYNNEKVVKTGSITDTTANCSKNSTKHITLLSGTINSVSEQKYTLYLWLDGNVTNSDVMMNQTFEVNLHADGTNATLVEGNSMSMISIERGSSNNITLQSLVYNFDSYAISSDVDNEPTSWTDMGCSDGSCDTSKKSIYQKTLSNVDLNYVNGLSYIWLKNTQGNITKIEIGKDYNITLNNNGATSAGTTSVYGIYKDGFYKDSSYQEKYASTETIVVPTKTNYSFSGYYSGSVMVIDSKGKFVSGIENKYYDDITLTAKWEANAYKLTYDCTTNGGSTANSTTSVAYDSNVDLSKTCSKSGWTFVGWNTSSTATSAMTSYKMPSNATTLYGIYKKEAITLTAKWNANGASLSTTADSSCTLAAVYNKATQATSCTVTAPTITRSGYTVVGYNTSASSTTNNSSYNTSSKVLTLTSSNTGKTWYVVSYKELSSNFYYYSGTAQTSTSAKCTVYNTTSVCTYTLPSVVSSSSGPDSGAYYGVSTAKSSSSTTTTYNSSTSNYYAVYEGKFTATYKKGDNVDSVGSTSNSCNNKFVSNGSTYSGTSCSITLPVITPSAGFVAMGWYNSSGTKIGNASASATLTSNITLTAKARNLTASELSYDNSATGEDCSDVQCMIDRLDTLIEERYGG